MRITVLTIFPLGTAVALGGFTTSIPHVGEHSDEVLGAAGYGDAESRSMRAEGVIG